MTMATRNNALVTIVIAAANTIINAGGIAYLLLLMIEATLFLRPITFLARLRIIGLTPCYHLTLDSCSLRVQEFPGESLWSWCSLSLLTLCLILLCAAGVPLN